MDFIVDRLDAVLAIARPLVLCVFQVDQIHVVRVQRVFRADCSCEVEVRVSCSGEAFVDVRSTACRSLAKAKHSDLTCGTEAGSDCVFGVWLFAVEQAPSSILLVHHAALNLSINQ